MEIRDGLSILDQIVYGRLCFLQRETPEVVQFSLRGWEEERERFFRAQRRAVRQLADFYDQAFQVVGVDTASIFAVHTMLLEDDDFVKTILHHICADGTTAEYAVRTVGETFAATFAQLDSPYMQARAADMRDIYRRVIHLLQKGIPDDDPLREGPVILVADEFLPSEVMRLNCKRLLGVISRKGSVDSHTAMLLRAYHIPAMTQVDLDPSWDGHLALLDGAGHRIYLDPERDVLEMLRERYQAGGKPRELVRT